MRDHVGLKRGDILRRTLVPQCRHELAIYGGRTRRKSSTTDTPARGVTGERGGDIALPRRGGSAHLQVASLMPSGTAIATLPAMRRFKSRQVTHVPTLPKQTRFPVASIDFSRRDVGLPFGVPRYVNAATLKAIAGGKRFDRLLKKTDAGWKFVDNDTMIDLTDGSREFKLGKLTIFS